MSLAPTVVTPRRMAGLSTTSVTCRGAVRDLPGRYALDARPPGRGGSLRPRQRGGSRYRYRRIGMFSKAHLRTAPPTHGAAFPHSLAVEQFRANAARAGPDLRPWAHRATRAPPLIFSTPGNELAVFRWCAGERRSNSAAPRKNARAGTKLTITSSQRAQHQAWAITCNRPHEV